MYSQKILEQAVNDLLSNIKVPVAKHPSERVLIDEVTSSGSWDYCYSEIEISYKNCRNLQTYLSQLVHTFVHYCNTVGTPSMYDSPYDNKVTSSAVQFIRLEPPSTFECSFISEYIKDDVILRSYRRDASNGGFIFRVDMGIRAYKPAFPMLWSLFK